MTCSSSQVLWLFRIQDMSGCVLLYQSYLCSCEKIFIFWAQETTGGTTKWIRSVTQTLISYINSFFPPTSYSSNLTPPILFSFWLHHIFSPPNAIFHSFHLLIFNTHVTTQSYQFYSEMSFKSDLPFVVLLLLPFIKL